MIINPTFKKTLKKSQATGTFTVINDRGLHTRPSTEIVKLASSFKADIRLAHQKMEVNAKSLLGILMLAAAKGTKIAITAFGEDADEAVASLIELAKNQFNMHY